MKRLISIFISLLLVNQSVMVYAQVGSSRTDNKPDISFFGIPRLPKSEVQRQCKPKFMREVCSQHYKYGVNRLEAWNAYYEASNAHVGEYWKLSPSKLYDKYDEVAKDIAYLWDINPEYIDMKRGEKITNFIVTWDIMVIALLAGTVIAPVLDGAGFKTAAQFSSLLPYKTEGFVSPLSYMIKSARTRFWADLGISMAYMAAETILIESAFTFVNQTAKELETLQEGVNSDHAVKSLNLLQGIINPNLTEEEQKELINNKDEIYNLKKELKETLKQAMEKQGWGDDTMVHTDAVVTLYALEYIRTEMADISDALRYREAVVDIAQIYSSGEVTDLDEDRFGLFNMLDEARQAALEEAAKRREAVQEQLNGAVLNMSGGKAG